MGTDGPAHRQLCERSAPVLQAQAILEREHGLAARVMDLRLNPLPVEAVRSHAVDCGRVLVVDECRATVAGWRTP